MNLELEPFLDDFWTSLKLDGRPHELEDGSPRIATAQRSLWMQCTCLGATHRSRSVTSTSAADVPRGATLFVDTSTKGRVLDGCDPTIIQAAPAPGCVPSRSIFVLCSIHAPLHLRSCSVPVYVGRRTFADSATDSKPTLRDFTEVGVRAEGGRTQKLAQAGGGTHRCGTA